MSSAHADERSPLLRSLPFFLLLVLCALPIVTPPIALALGLLLGLTVGAPFPEARARWTKILLQASVVGLGFGMNAESVLHAGAEGLALAVLSVFGTLAIGLLLRRWLAVDATTGDLIACGTAICGGSAIAAVGPVLGADNRQMSVALGVVFVLNAVALFLFPVLGEVLDLRQEQFGMWAAIAIHDTSSVVGAGAAYGSVALAVAVTVKLFRALWIIPLALGASRVRRTEGTRITIPWFIFLFVVAVALRTLFGEVGGLFPTLAGIAKQGMTVTLFLIGAGLSREALKSVGVRPLVMGVLLWVIVSCAALAAVLAIDSI